MEKLLELLLSGIVVPFIYEIFKKYIDNKKDPFNTERILVSVYTGIPISMLILFVLGFIFKQDIDFFKSILSTNSWYYLLLFSPFICLIWYVILPASFLNAKELKMPKTFFKNLVFNTAGFIGFYFSLGTTICWGTLIGWLIPYELKKSEIVDKYTILLLIVAIGVISLNYILWKRILKNLVRFDV